ncbi:GNAT family N-acetyltransferase [Arthrobacter pigmenti]|nr:GNAT family N-acetyltransferase [Arthrobacter pigmenti]
MNAMVTIRPLRIHEIEAALRMKNQGWRQAYRGKLSEEILAGLDDSIEAQAEAWRMGFDATGVVPFVAVDDDGAIVGIAGGGATRGDNPPTDVELFMIYVLEEHYGTGLGQALADAVIGNAAACVWVLDGNERAIAFYRKLGFEPDGAKEQLSERWNGLNDIRMVRPAMSAPAH